MKINKKKIKIEKIEKIENLQIFSVKVGHQKVNLKTK